MQRRVVTAVRIITALLCLCLLACGALAALLLARPAGPAGAIPPTPWGAAVAACLLVLAGLAAGALALLRRDYARAERELTRSFTRGGPQLHATEQMATLGRLAAGVAHEIRNPLTSIKMRLFSLGRELEEDSSRREDLAVISEEVNRLESIVQNFLQFARPPEIKAEPVPVDDILGAVLDLLGHRFQSQGILVVREPPASGITVLADKHQLRQVFMNILINACDAMLDGGRVTVACRVEGEGSLPMARVSVGNSGPPIPPEDAAHIFDPFFSTRDDGTGLGLSIARQIVEQHGGRLDLDAPREGDGAAFAVTLPLATERNDEPDTDRR